MADADVPTGLDHVTRQRVLGWMLARFTLWSVSLGIAIGLDGLGADLSPYARRGLDVTAAAAFGWALISAAWFTRVTRAQRFAAFQIAADVAIVTALVHFSGGRESVFSVLYMFIAVYGALFFTGLGALRAATLCAAAYGAVLWAGNLELPPIPATAPSVAWSMLGAIWGVHVGALFLSGALASVLSRELHRSASDLYRLKDLHERTVDSLLSGLLTTDSEYRITSFNPEAERITGAPADGVAGLNLDEVIPGACAIVGALRGERRRAEFMPRSRLPYRNRDGRELFLGVAGSILRDEKGRPVGNVVIFQDVTQVVEMERELRRSERLAAVGEMAAKMAHEIRNPLAAISGSIQVLQRDQAAASREGEPACLMDIVVRETDRLNDLIADFLHYARPRPLRIEAVSLPGVVEELLKMLEAVCPENVAIRSGALQDVAVAADADQLRQVLWNLSLNALQAMPEGGELVLSSRVVSTPVAQGSSQLDRREIGSAEEDAGDRGESTWVEICVRDTGVGIDAEVQERIFEPFYTTKPKGTGLGLATVHRIVEAHGGVLKVKSEPGQGTEVAVAFPRFAALESESQ